MSDLTTIGPGVAFNAPPETLQPSIRASIDSAIAALTPGKTVALVALANEHGTNAAIVARAGDVWTVEAWVGKEWKTGETQYGATVKASW